MSLPYKPFCPRTSLYQLWLLTALAILLALILAQPADGLTVLSHASNVEVVLGLPASQLEFENPLTGSERVNGLKMVEWRDADYAAGPPRWYDDWTVNNPASIDGNVNEIWMRQAGDVITTSTTVPSRTVSIHMTGDSNDGLAEVEVDGVVVALIDMNSPQGSERVLLVVYNLASAPHNIRIKDLGVGPSGLGDDVHAFGAAALVKESVDKWSQPPVIANPSNLYYGWNEVSVHGGAQIVADDWVCTTPDPVTHITWWGSHKNWTLTTPPTAAALPFHLAIWTDVPAGVTAYSHPGQVIWEADALSYSVQFVGWDYDPLTQTFETCFRYDVALTQPQYFYQPAGDQIYWLSVAAVYPQGVPLENPWGWKMRPREPASPAPDDAVVVGIPTAPHVGMIYEAGAPIWWPTLRDSWDAAFQLTSRTGVKFEQPYNPAYSGVHAHDFGLPVGWTTLADDWRCAGGLVTDLHWWGNYETGPGGIELRGSGIQYFSLSIHGDIPGPPYSRPGPALWTRNVPLLAAKETATGVTNPEGSMIYEYRYDLPEPFPQVTGQVYWMDVTARSNQAVNPARWRWQEANRTPTPYLDAAVSSMTGGSWSPIQWSEGFSELAFAVTSGPIQMVTKWSQPPMPYVPPDAYHGWNEPSVYGSEWIAADDWICSTADPVTDIHWWGSFKNWMGHEPPSDAPMAFHIGIWTDVPAGVDGFSHPGEMIWQVICDRFTSTFVGWDIDPRDPNAPPEACFLFEQDLLPAEYFQQEAGQHVYWVSISAMYLNGVTTPHVFGWKTLPHDPVLNPDDAVRIFMPNAPLPGMPYASGQPIFWPTPAESWDLAFRLTTTPPQPRNDFGDAPDPTYPTLAASNGASHTLSNFWLGATIDAEADGQPTPAANGDDLAGTPDEDGVVFNTPLAPGQPATITVFVTSPMDPVVLSAWIDFNGDGTWATAGDNIFVAMLVHPGVNVLGFVVPPTATPNIGTYARFRLHTNPGGVPFFGALPYGEVEDYAVQIADEPPTPVKWQSWRHHGPEAPNAELPIVLNRTASGNGVSGPTSETRRGGIQKITVDFSRPVVLVNPAAITITGRTTPLGGPMGPPVAYSPLTVAMIDGDTLQMTFAVAPAIGALPDDTCYNMNVAGSVVDMYGQGTVGDTDCNVRSLQGDTRLTGDVNLGDVLFTKSMIGTSAAAAPEHDVNVTGGTINLGDCLYIKTRVTSPPHRALCP